MHTMQTRFDGTVWIHDSGTRWVTHYPETTTRKGYYQAYRAIHPVPKGRDPWTIDNRRIGPEDCGFPTLESAINAMESFK